MKLVLIGAGGHARSVLDAALRMKCFEQIVLTDAQAKPGSYVLGCEVAGSDDMLESLFEDGFHHAFVAIGSKKDTTLRRRLAQKAYEIGYEFPNIADPSAVVSDYAKLGQGIFIGKGAIINAQATVEDHSIVNTGAIIEHECRIGSFTHIAVGAAICGKSTVGTDCLIGAGATVVDGIHIGDKAVVGANATVLSDVQGNEVVVGVYKI